MGQKSRIDANFRLFIYVLFFGTFNGIFVFEDIFGTLITW